MAVIEKQLSTFIEKQFPAFYRDEGPVFVAFVKEYYRWLESQSVVATKPDPSSWVTITASNNTVVGTNTSFSTDIANGSQIAIYRDENYYDLFTVNTVANDTFLTVVSSPGFSNAKTHWAQTKTERNVSYDARRFPEYTDVDTTLDEFIVHFKNEYLTGIQFDVNSNIRMLLKHALDLYRAKGTSEAIKLLFRIVFGTDIDVYFPGDDLFKLSDGEWRVPRYIEIALTDVAPQLVNKQILGCSSGATAFVDRAVRRQVNNRLTDILYVSAIQGDFQTDELIDLIDHSLDPSKRPVVVGSLTTVDVDENGSGEKFKVGDIVDVYSTLGSGARARVANTVDSSGVLNYSLNFGGYGYEAGSNTQVIISDYVFILANTSVDETLNPWANAYFNQFETVTQPMATFAYSNANGTLQTGMNVYTWANGVNVGQGKLLAVVAANSSSGAARVSITSGNVHANQFYTYANAITANQSTYADVSATGNVVGYTSNVVLTVTNISSSVSVGDNVYQYNSTNSVSVAAQVLRVAPSGSNVIVTVGNANGVFVVGRGLYDNTETYYGNTIDISIQVGVKLIGSNTFYSSPYSLIYAGDSNTHAYLSTISFGSGGNVTMSSTLNNPETVNINVDYLNPYLSVSLNATAYGLPASPSGNISSVINSCMTNQSITIGQLSGIATITKGSGYSAPPIIVVIDNQVKEYYEYDYVLNVANASAVFAIGEIVTQTSTGARGLVLDANDSIVHLERLNFNVANDFIITTNTTNMISGTSSGFTANVTAVNVYNTGNPIGLDANVSSILSTANGAITEIELIESGYGFLNNKDVTIVGANGTVNATGTGFTGKIGSGRGYYRRKGGFLSDQKKLQDGYYWQNYSYDIRSSVALDKYKEMLRQVVHVAGTKNFATLVTKTTTGVPLKTEGSVKTIS